MGRFERVFEIDAAAGAFWMGGKEAFEFDEIVWVAGTVGIEAGHHTIEAIEAVEAPEGFVHADFAGEPDSCVLLRQVRELQQVNSEILVAILSAPKACLF